MDKEVESTVQISVTMIALSLLILFFIYLATVGQSMKEKSYAYAVSVESANSVGALDELVRAESTIMPVVSAYNILCNYSEYIDEFVCFHCIAKKVARDSTVPATTLLPAIDENVTNISQISGNCLTTHLNGKCRLVVSKNGMTGAYRVYLHGVECTTVLNTKCTCSQYPHELVSGANLSTHKSNCTCSIYPHDETCALAHKGLLNGTFMSGANSCTCWKLSRWSDLA